jgi:predicted small metal-binding protein
VKSTGQDPEQRLEHLAGRASTRLVTRDGEVEIDSAAYHAHTWFCCYTNFAAGGSIGHAQSRRSSIGGRPIMAKVLRCGDLVPGCNAVIEGKDEAEVMAKGAEHAKTAHKMTAIPPEMAAKVKAAITEKK